MAKSNLNAFDDWADTNKLFVRSEDQQGVADAYSEWWRATTGKPLTALVEPDTPFVGRPWRKGSVAPAYGGFVTVITEASLLSRRQVLDLARHISRVLSALVIVAPRAAEGAKWGYAVFEAGTVVFAQNVDDNLDEPFVKSQGKAWLTAMNIRPSGWVFDEICQVIGLRVWEINPKDKYTYYSMDERP